MQKIERKDQFIRRLASLDHRHKALGHRFAPRVHSNGLVVVRSDQRWRAEVRWLFLTLLVLVGFFAFKAVMLDRLGDEAYQARVAKFAQGNVVEQAAAWSFQIDPVTQSLAQALDIARQKIGPLQISL